MGNEPFKHVYPIKNGDIPASYVSLPGGNLGGFSPLFWFNTQYGENRRFGDEWAPLKLTNRPFKNDGWKTMVSFWGNLGLCSGAFALSFRECNISYL